MKKFLVTVMLVGFVLSPFLSSAQTTDAERKKQIESQLQKLEMQMIQTERLLQSKQGERQSLERDLTIIDAQIDKAQLGIKAREVAISQLSDQISDKEAVIDILNARLEKQGKSLAELVRKTEQVDDYSLAEVMLSNQSFSDFFTDFESFRSINDSLNESLVALRQIKADTQRQRDSLTDKQLTEAELKEVQIQQKKEIEAREAEKAKILKVTKGEEETYQELVQSQQKTITQLKAELFDLLGGGGQIKLTDAIVLAKRAGGAAGVDPALILAILQQESSFGANIGSCTMGDVSLGKDIMHPDRDKPVFLAIANTLGFDPATQPVSCPLKRADGSRIGWGGAMGASQFIPSTWAIYGGGYANGQYNVSQDSIRAILGKSTPSSPFNNQDAFTATALLLRDNGANGTYTGDRLAALRYYAGWGGASNPENAFYGDQVMQRKAQLQQDIKTLDAG